MFGLHRKSKEKKLVWTYSGFLVASGLKDGLAQKIAADEAARCFAMAYSVGAIGAIAAMFGLSPSTTQTHGCLGFCAAVGINPYSVEAEYERVFRACDSVPALMFMFSTAALLAIAYCRDGDTEHLDVAPMLIAIDPMPIRLHAKLHAMRLKYGSAFIEPLKSPADRAFWLGEDPLESIAGLM